MLNSSEHGTNDNEDIENRIAAIKQGDTEKYRLIIERYQKSLYIYCYYLLQDKGQAEDAVQDIFLKAYQHITEYEKKVSFTAWIYRIAYNHCMNINKKHARDKRLFRIFQNTQTVRPFVQHQSDDLLDLIEMLTFDEKHILVLRAVEEYSYEEIGQVLHITSASARKRYERIRKKLIKKKGKGGLTHEPSLKTTRG
ncbi:RNA polymerase sigma factor [Paenibacillus sp. Marseille-Q4541]|uniref:RNA polymerase sigma factor n=1 Tax=Paenibacillus sp. Marseille-Q4541 TaxID=2831522 RepID=UPI001BA70887|nr:RNA polymerase sigma factor [Paenibacillus sp. Marseille-Q4541]